MPIKKCDHCGKGILCDNCKKPAWDINREQLIVYALYAIYGLTQEDIAEYLGMSQPTVSRRLERVRKHRPDLFMGDCAVPDLFRMVNLDNIDESKLKHKF